MNERYNGAGIDTHAESLAIEVASLFSNKEKALTLIQEYSVGNGMLKTARGETVALQDLLNSVVSDLQNRQRSNDEASHAQKPRQLSLEILQAYLKGEATDDFFNQLEVQATTAFTATPNLSGGSSKRRQALDRLELEQDARDNGIPEPDQRT